MQRYFLFDKLSKFRVAGGTLRFTEKDPIPDSVVKYVIRYRLKSI
jgi:hypothetical protein